MHLSLSCSWCHFDVSAHVHAAAGIGPGPGTAGTPRHCPGCGHRADLPREDCDCPDCRATLEKWDRFLDAEAPTGEYHPCPHRG